MDTIMYYLSWPFGWIMKWCWELVGNYGLAIILFTLATKIILLPLSVWVHKNSIKMVTVQPEINKLHAKYYGNRDKIAEEETELYKQMGYNPFASSIPLIVQLVLLAAVVAIIKQPLSHILRLDAATVGQLASAIGENAADLAETELKIVTAALSGKLDALTDPALAEAVAAVKTLDLSFLGFDLGVETYDVMGRYIWVPIVAGVASLILCWVQNAINILQVEQSKLSKYGMTVFSVGISLVLGFFVYSGVALYWVASNLFAILQQVCLNAVINPWHYVDRGELETSRQALADIEALDKKGKNDPLAKEYARREKADYKRFFKIVNKKLVVYSERSGFYKYFEALIEGLLKSSNLTVHYITSDPNDAMFKRAESEPRIKVYYIGPRRLITLMMKLDTDICIMTTPDLENFYIKRSLYRKDVEYIYVPHDMMSVHMGFRKGALDHFDTVFATGAHVEREIRATEKVFSLPQKTVVSFGYPLAEKLEQAYIAMDKTPHEKKEILIAPSWQEDNLLDSVIDVLIEKLTADDVHLTVRPHPEYVKRYPDRIEALTDKYRDMPNDRLTFELDFTVNTSIYSSDLLITDWSAIAYEFCFSTKKPVLFVNTKIKMENPDYRDIPDIPVEISLRDRVGISLEKDELPTRVDACARDLLAHGDDWNARITDLLHSHLFSYGTNGALGVKYILTRLVEIQNRKKAENAATSHKK